jgi:DNA-binding transcriptional MerR regulator
LHEKSGLKIAQIRQFIDLCMQGDMTLLARYQFLDREEAALTKQINTLQAQLDFLRYKKWYFKTAVEAGTEKIHMTQDGKRVQPDIKEQYEADLAKCVDLRALLDLPDTEAAAFAKKMTANG